MNSTLQLILALPQKGLGPKTNSGIKECDCKCILRTWWTRRRSRRIRPK